MYQRVKSTIFTIIYLLLWTRFLVMVLDPYWGGVSLEQGLAIFRDWRGILDTLYLVSGYLAWPIYLVYGWISPFLPQLSWFPGLTSQALLQQIGVAVPSAAQSLQQPLLQQAFVGYIDLLVIVAVVFFRILNPLIDYAYDSIKNMIWTVLIEMSFTKRKEARYQEALEKRAADLMKLNVEYKNLSKEASMLAHSVVTDELTKVYNKRFFLEKIQFEFKNAKDKKGVLAIAMVDIDHFKKLNDTYGHLLGDKVLQAVAHVAKRNTPVDCYCCRFGGEEFSIIMPGKRPEAALQIISTIHQSLPMLRFEEDPNLRTSASFGVCVVDFKAPEAQNINTFEDFIKLADDGLYRAKLNGRNRIEPHIIVPSP